MLDRERLFEPRAALTKHFGMIDRGKLPAIIVAIRRFTLTGRRWGKRKFIAGENVIAGYVLVRSEKWNATRPAY